MIEASGGGAAGPGEPLDDAGAEDPRAFSHASHFSVSVRSAQGYRLHQIDEILVIGANGHIVSLEPPQLPAGRRGRAGAMAVPVACLSRSHDPVRFLWGPARSVLGPCGALPGDAAAADHHLKYRALHRQVLEGVGDMALQAFLRFLERESAGAAAEFPSLAARPRCKLAFRFQYDEHYLHERHAAQLAWKRFLTENRAEPDRAAGLP